MKRLCAAAGCAALVEKGRCPKHATTSLREQRKAYDERRGGEYRKRYMTKAWRAIRLAVARRDGWICQLCGRPIVRDSDLHCDHIKAVVDGGTDELSNLRATHHACHSRRTMRENLNTCRCRASEPPAGGNG